MRITREQFREVYKHCPTILEQEELFYNKPKTDLEVLTLYLPSKLWRLNNVYTIVDKFGKRIKFQMNLSQHKVYAASLRHPRVIVLKSRQQGISTLWLVSFFDDLCTRKDYSIGLMAQGQDEASTLLERTKILWDTLDYNIKAYWNLSVNNDNTKEFGLSNGSKIFVRTSFRSTTLQRLHVSEMGKIANSRPDKAKEVKTGTLQAIAPGNIAIIESTAEGDNLFKTDYDTAAELDFEELTTKDFLAVFLSWIDDPDCFEERDQIINERHAKYFKRIENELGVTLTRIQKNFWIAKWRELGDKIYQEYPSTAEEAFLATKDGTYYAHLYFEFVKKLGRDAVENLYDPNLDVQIAVDLGMNDTNVLTVFQTYLDEWRIIDEIYDDGQQISYYTDIVKLKPWFPQLTHLILPPDSEVKELTSGKKRIDVFREELPGIEITQLPKIGVREGIEQVRQIIPMLWLDKALDYLPKCIKSYHKEWDEKRERFRDQPEHDESSNGADSIRYMATGGKAGKYKRKAKKSSTGMDV